MVSHDRVSAKFAPVAPIQIMEALLEQPKGVTLFGDYHLLLAHHVADSRFRDRFTALFTDWEIKNRDAPICRVIMDNSVVELGGAVDSRMIRSAVDAITELPRLLNGVPRIKVYPVLPDVMNKGQATLELSAATYDHWVSNDEDRRMPGDYMLVTQGEDFDEFAYVVDYFFITNQQKYYRIKWVGIPRVLTASLGSRRRAIEYIRMIRPDLRIHLLGFSDDMVDDFLCCRIKGVSGIDSAVPLRLSYHITPIMAPPPRSKSPNWFDHGTLTPENITNVNNVRRWITRDQ